MMNPAAKDYLFELLEKDFLQKSLQEKQVTGLHGFSKTLFLASLLRGNSEKTDTPSGADILFMLCDMSPLASMASETADRIQELKELLPENTVFEYPAYDGRAETLYQRLQLRLALALSGELQKSEQRPKLSRLKHDEAVYASDDGLHGLHALSGSSALSEAEVDAQQPIIIFSAEAQLHENIEAAETFFSDSITVTRGMNLEQRVFRKKLEQLGYRRETEVCEPGEFSLAGETIELYSPSESLPLRLYFFGDELEELRSYHPLTRKILAKKNTVFIPPFRELSAWQDQAGAEPEGAKLFDYIDARNNVARLPAAASSQDKTILLLKEYGSAVDADEACLELAEKADLLSLKSRRVNFPKVKAASEKKQKKQSSSPSRLGQSLPSSLLQRRLNIQSLAFVAGLGKQFFVLPFFKQNIQEAKRVFASRLEKGDTILLFSEQRFGLRKLEEVFHELKPRSFLKRTHEAGNLAGPRQIEIEIEQGALNLIEGFVAKGMQTKNTLLMSDYEIFSRRKTLHRHKHKPKNPAAAMEKQQDFFEHFLFLQENQLAVHAEYGVGLYSGLCRLRMNEVEKDYLLLEYRDSAKLYVPIENMHLVERYLGDGQRRKLDRLDKEYFKKVKERVKKETAELAEKFLNFYAKRERERTAPFGQDSVFQAAFEAEFPFTETEDQLIAARKLKGFLENEKPVDALLCGDVGFGKTEVALRAVFKAAMCGRQTLFLTPSTLLCLQHYSNFKKRFAGYPVSVGALNRFVKGKEKQETLATLANGSLDIVVATHAAFGKAINFKNLGLLIIDEEQKFGVKQKEHIKERFPNVHTISLSATPIPRTLSMTLSNLRPLLLLKKPPAGRLPIVVHSGPFQEEKIRQAYAEEKKRGGQIFFVHNRIESIAGMGRFIAKVLPEATMTMVHGKMPERELEQHFKDFSERKFDILLSTNIIGSGLDLENVNTLLVSHAERFGLTELYQLKGRIGRAKRQAYAYFFHSDKVSEAAFERLQYIQEYTELGAGFSLAMRDLEMRGAGNLLGTEQSGNLSLIGLELYSKLLQQAVTEKRRREQKALEYAGGMAKLEEAGLRLEEAGPNLEGEYQKEQHKPECKAAAFNKNMYLSLNEEFAQEDEARPFPRTLVDLQETAYLPSEYFCDEQSRMRFYKELSSLSDAGELLSLKKKLLMLHSTEADREEADEMLPKPIQNLIDNCALKLWAMPQRIISILEKKSSAKEKRCIELRFQKQAAINIGSLMELVQQSIIKMQREEGEVYALLVEFDRESQKTKAEAISLRPRKSAASNFSAMPKFPKLAEKPIKKNRQRDIRHDIKVFVSGISLDEHALEELEK